MQQRNRMFLAAPAELDWMILSMRCVRLLLWYCSTRAWRTTASASRCCWSRRPVRRSATGWRDAIRCTRRPTAATSTSWPLCWPCASRRSAAPKRTRRPPIWRARMASTPAPAASVLFCLSRLRVLVCVCVCATNHSIVSWRFFHVQKVNGSMYWWRCSWDSKIIWAISVCVKTTTSARHLFLYVTFFCQHKCRRFISNSLSLAIYFYFFIYSYGVK